MKISLSLLLLSAFGAGVNAKSLRTQARRYRTVRDFSSVSNRWKNGFRTGPSEAEKELLVEVEEEEDIKEMMQAMAAYEYNGHSMGPDPTAPPMAASLPPNPAPATGSPSAAASPVTPVPTITPTQYLSQAPTDMPSDLPTISSEPSVSPTQFPTTGPTMTECLMPVQERTAQILALLESVADPILIGDTSTPQGQATFWLIFQDGLRLCPDDPKILQRWVLAVMYFSTGGNDWRLCSATGTDACGTLSPFVGKLRFLSDHSECTWAGISCDVAECVTEIEFERNNLIGTIPSELGLLSELVILGMEQGGLVSTIPSELGGLSNLIFLDLDYNSLTGSIPTEIFQLSLLTQLDLNDNRLSGSIEGIQNFGAIEFLQLHTNFFTGTIPLDIGLYNLMETFTIHETNVTGSMPDTVCQLRDTNGGNLTSLIADCADPGDGNPIEVECSCCSDCRQDNLII